MKYNFYIDEAGDEGIDTSGTRWFLVGGILVPKSEDLTVARAVDRVKKTIRQRNKSKPMHWSDIRNQNKRLAVINEFGKLPVDFILCAMHKESIVEKAVFKKKQCLYNYVVKHIVERVTWRVRDLTEGKGLVDLQFESRASMSYSDLNNYLKAVASTPGSEVYGEVLGRAIPRTKNLKNLQIADSYIGACFKAFEPNIYGMTDPSYVPFISDRFYRRGGNLLSYGLKVLPHDAAERLVEQNQWLKGL